MNKADRKSDSHTPHRTNKRRIGNFVAALLVLTLLFASVLAAQESSCAWAATGNWTNIAGTYDYPTGIAVDSAGDVFMVNSY